MGYTDGKMAIPNKQQEENLATEAVEVFEEVGETAAKLARKTVVRSFEYLGEIVTLLWQAIRSLREGVHLGDLFRQLGIVGTETNGRYTSATLDVPTAGAGLFLLPPALLPGVRPARRTRALGSGLHWIAPEPSFVELGWA